MSYIYVLLRICGGLETREKSPTNFIDGTPVDYTTMDVIMGDERAREPAAVSGETTTTRPRDEQSTRLHVQTHVFKWENHRIIIIYINIYTCVRNNNMYIVKHSVTRNVRLAYVGPWRPPNVPLPVRSVAASDDDRATIPETAAHMTSSSSSSSYNTF